MLLGLFKSVLNTMARVTSGILKPLGRKISGPYKDKVQLNLG